MFLCFLAKLQWRDSYTENELELSPITESTLRRDLIMSSNNRRNEYCKQKLSVSLNLDTSISTLSCSTLCSDIYIMYWHAKCELQKVIVVPKSYTAVLYLTEMTVTVFNFYFFFSFFGELQSGRALDVTAYYHNYCWPKYHWISVQLSSKMNVLLQLLEIGKYLQLEKSTCWQHHLSLSTITFRFKLIQ